MWKVHGSADQPESICTTLEQIFILDLPLLSQLRDLFAQYRPRLLGYSGRDIDLFPFIASFPFRDNLPAFWLCIEFSQTRGIFARPERFTGIQRSSDAFANAVVATLDEGCPVVRRVRSTADRSLAASARSVVRGDTLRVYLKAAQRVVREQILPALASSEGDIGRFYMPCR